MTQHDSQPQPHLFAQALDIEVRTVNVSEIEFPEGTEINPAIEGPGVLQSVFLTRTGNPEVPYRIIDGKRRVRSAVAYGHEQVPAIVTDGTRGQLAAASAMLNAARNDNPLDEARNWQIALEEGRYLSVKDLAKDIRVNAATIKKRLKLLSLPESLLVHVGTMIADGVAEKMANLPPEYLAEAVNAAERQLDQGRKFTGKDLRNSLVKRRDDQESSLDGLFESAGLPELFESVSPLEQVTQEVRRLAAIHGVALSDVVAALELEAAEPRPQAAAVQPESVNAVLDDWFGPDEENVETASADTASAEEVDWLSDAPSTLPTTPITTPTPRIQLGIRSA